jgi:hypothetical protein
MQPYQKATEEVLRQRKAPIKALELVASGAAAYAGGSLASKAFGSGIASRITPFLNKHIPEDIAMKGLKKIDPKIHDFANLAKEYGNSFDTIRGFLEDKITSEDSKKSSSGDKNIIQQYSPELFEFINSEMQKGRAPLEAGALAELQPNFKKIIKKMAEDHKTTFASILQTIFGQGQQGQQQGMAQTQQEQPQQPQQGQQASGNGNALLLQAIQSINQRLGGQ